MRRIALILVMFIGACVALAEPSYSVQVSRAEEFWESQMRALSRAMTDPTIDSRVRNIWFQLVRYSNSMYPVVPAQQFTMGQALPNGTILLDLSTAADDAREVTAFWLAHEYGHQVLQHPRLQVTTVGRWMVALGGTSQEDAADRWAGRFLKANSYVIRPVLTALCSLPGGGSGDAHSTGPERAKNVAAAYGDSAAAPCREAPTRKLATYSPTISMWTARQGNPTTFDLLVDGEHAGSLSNLDDDDISLELEDLTEGNHSFTMSDITVFGVIPTPFGPQMQVIARNLECSTTVQIRSNARLRIAATLRPTGEVQCRIQ